jgi:hippurate hydrolase
MNDLKSMVADALSDTIALRHDLHSHPQLGYEETYASAVIQEHLKESGIPFQAGLAKTGVVGWIVPDNSAPDATAVGLRADIDALPICERTGLPYASQNPGLMHACGHDGHTAILLATARILAKRRNLLQKPVKFVFQPAEECGIGSAGAERMIADGALSETVGGHRVDSMFGLHGAPQIPVGYVATKSGPLLAGYADFEMVVTGVGGHAAMPHALTDPIVAAAAIVSSLQTIVARNLDPTQGAVVSICRIHGGEATNVIPDRVSLSGTIRAFLPEVFVLLTRRISEIAEFTAKSFGCTSEVTFTPTHPSVINDTNATAFALGIADSVAGAERVLRMDAPVLASEDFSFYGRIVPSCFSLIGVMPLGCDHYPGLHSAQFDFSDAALETGIRLMCGYALAG